jgi:hypothetical protein
LRERHDRSSGEMIERCAADYTNAAVSLTRALDERSE